MRKDIKWVIYLIGLGASLVVFAENKFVTKDMMGLIMDKLVSIETHVKTLDKRIYDLNKDR